MFSKKRYLKIKLFNILDESKPILKIGIFFSLVFEFCFLFTISPVIKRPLNIFFENASTVSYFDCKYVLIFS